MQKVWSRIVRVACEDLQVACYKQSTNNHPCATVIYEKSRDLQRERQSLRLYCQNIWSSWIFEKKKHFLHFNKKNYSFLRAKDNFSQQTQTEVMIKNW